MSLSKLNTYCVSGIAVHLPLACQLSFRLLSTDWCLTLEWRLRERTCLALRHTVPLKDCPLKDQLLLSSPRHLFPSLASVLLRLCPRVRSFACAANCGTPEERSHLLAALEAALSRWRISKIVLSSGYHHCQTFIDSQWRCLERTLTAGTLTHLTLSSHFAYFTKITHFPPPFPSSFLSHLSSLQVHSMDASQLIRLPSNLRRLAIGRLSQSSQMVAIPSAGKHPSLRHLTIGAIFVAYPWGMLTICSLIRQLIYRLCTTFSRLECFHFLTVKQPANSGFLPSFAYLTAKLVHLRRLRTLSFGLESCQMAEILPQYDDRDCSAALWVLPSITTLHLYRYGERFPSRQSLCVTRLARRLLQVFPHLRSIVVHSPPGMSAIFIALLAQCLPVDMELQFEPLTP